MNEQDKAIFDRILQTNPEELTPYEVKFLNARRDYLNKEQRRVFASVLIDEAAPNILDENGQYTGTKVEGKPEEPAKQPEVAPAPTRKELEAKAAELGFTEDAIKGAKKNADLETLIASAPTKSETSEPADPDAK